MVTLSLAEAQLFKLLSGLFGDDRVVPQMRVIAVCGGEVPGDASEAAAERRRWAESNRCLFTVVDADDDPVLVVEFFGGFAQYVDPAEEEHQRILKPLLEACGIRYVTISPAEFSEILDPGSSLDLVALLNDKVDRSVGLSDDFN